MPEVRDTVVVADPRSCLVRKWEWPRHQPSLLPPGLLERSIVADRPDQFAADAVVGRALPRAANTL